MSGQATGWVLRHGPHPDMVDREGQPYGVRRARALRSVLHSIADSANALGHHAHPGTALLMEQTLYARRQVLKLTKELEAEGWLLIEERGGGAGRANVWTVVGVDGTAPPPRVLAAETVHSGHPSAEDERVHSQTETVHCEPQTVHSGVHPNGLSTVDPTVPPSSPPADAELVLLDAPPAAKCEHRSYDCEHFTAFWAIQRRKIDKPKALNALRSALKRASIDEILAGAERWNAYFEERNEPSYEPHPTTWLNGDRWEADPPRLAPTNRRAQAERDAMAAFAVLDERPALPGPTMREVG